MLGEHVGSNLTTSGQGFRRHGSPFRPQTWTPGALLKPSLWLATGLVLSGMGCTFSGPDYAVAKPITLNIKPETAILTAGRRMKFGYDITSPFGTSVTWRVREADGGSVDSSGYYQAPETPGTYQLEVASTADPSRVAAANVVVVATPHGPITAPEVVESGASGLWASVPDSPGTTYQWSIEGGRLQSSPSAHQISFSAGKAPKVVLSCRLVNAAGDALTLVQEIRKAPPVVFRLDKASVFLTAGHSMRFGCALSGGILPSVLWRVPDPSQGQVDQTGLYTAPEAPGKYIVRAWPDVAPSQAASINVNVVAAPVGSILAVKQVAPDHAEHVARLFARPGLKSEWSIEGGTILGPADGQHLTFSAGQGPELVLRCKLTNEAGDTFTASDTISVEPGG